MLCSFAGQLTLVAIIFLSWRLRKRHVEIWKYIKLISNCNWIMTVELFPSGYCICSRWLGWMELWIGGPSWRFSMLIVKADLCRITPSLSRSVISLCSRKGYWLPSPLFYPKMTTSVRKWLMINRPNIPSVNFLFNFLTSSMTICHMLVLKKTITDTVITIFYRE